MSGLKISLLGGMEIGPDGGAPEAAVTRKAGAMIAYLALQDGHAQSREKLAGLLWSRNTDDQARTNLRQALSRLRKALSNGKEAPLVAEGDRVALDMDAVELDAARFETLTADGTPDALEEAIALYRGDLLDGINLAESGFDSWLRGERERFRVMAVDTLLKLIEHYEAAGDADRCIRAGLRLLAIDPLQEAGHRALMRTYATQGRLALALEQYESCRELLRDELDEEPEADTTALFEDIRQHRSNGNGTAAEPATVDHVDFDITGGRPSIAVLPFINRNGDPSGDYLVDGITENILAGLTRFRDLFVIAGGTMGMLSGADLDPAQAGKRLGVAHVLEGSVLRSGGRLRVTVQLVDTRTGQRLWAEMYDRHADDLLAVQDSITTNIVASLVGEVEEASRLRAEAKPPENMVAYDYFLRARHRMKGGGKDDTLEARRLFDRALELDCGLAGAWAGLSVSYLTEYEADWSPLGRLQALDRARDHGNRAVSLDDGCNFGHWSLACVDFYRHCAGRAELHIDRAIVLNPNEYRNYCVKGWMLVLSGKPADGISCALEGQRINPLASAGCHINIGIGEFTAGNYQTAIESLARANKPTNLRDVFITASHGHLGQVEEARMMARGVESSARPLAEAYGGTERDNWHAYWTGLFPYQAETDFEHFIDGLRKAGLPT